MAYSLTLLELYTNNYTFRKPLVPGPFPLIIGDTALLKIPPTCIGGILLTNYFSNFVLRPSLNVANL
ncbi:MAG: hypothetical protein K0S61_2094 [Anaerocolumna sp.]|nr:hypothetical protein [Anaerocolumna sp.]